MGGLLTLLGLTGLFKIPLSFLICILKTSAFTCLKVFPKSSLKQENKKKEVTFTIYPSKIKYRQVQFTSFGKKKLWSTVFKVIATEMKYVIPEKKFTWQYGICLTFKTYRRLESQQKAWIFPSFDDVQDNSLLKQFLLETKILKVLQKARGNTLDKEGLKILMNSLKNALKILNSLDTDLCSQLGIGCH